MPTLTEFLKDLAPKAPTGATIVDYFREPEGFVPDEPEGFVPDPPGVQMAEAMKGLSAQKIAGTEKLTPEERRKAWQAFTSPVIPLGEDIKGETLPQELVAAPINVAKHLVEGLESPMGFFAAPFAGGGAVARGVMGLGFGLPMAAQSLKKVYEGAATGDVQQTLEGAGETLLGGGMAALGGHEFMPGAPEPQPFTPGYLLRMQQGARTQLPTPPTPVVPPDPYTGIYPPDWLTRKTAPPGAIGPDVPLVPGAMGQMTRGDLGPTVTAEQRLDQPGYQDLFGGRARWQRLGLPEPPEGLPGFPREVARRIEVTPTQLPIQVTPPPKKPGEEGQAPEPAPKQPPPTPQPPADEGGVTVPEVPKEPVKPAPAEVTVDPKLENRKQTLLRANEALDRRLATFKSDPQKLRDIVIERNMRKQQGVKDITPNQLLEEMTAERDKNLAEIQGIEERQKQITTRKKTVEETKVTKAEAEAVKPTKPPVSGPAGFVTSQGSQYSIDEFGQTTRLKRSEGAGQGTMFPPHTVVYLSPEAAKVVLETGQDQVLAAKVILANRQPNNTWLQIKPEAGEDIRSRVDDPHVLWVNRTTGKIIAAVKATHTPEVGKQPFEIVYKAGGEKSTHLGNPITEVRTLPSDTPKLPRRGGIEQLPPRLQVEFARAEQSLKEGDHITARAIINSIRDEAARIAGGEVTPARGKLLDAINGLLDEYEAEFQQINKEGGEKVISQKGRLPEEILNYHLNKGPDSYKRLAGIRFGTMGARTVLQHAQEIVSNLEAKIFTNDLRNEPDKYLGEFDQATQEKTAAAMRITNWMRKTQMTDTQRAKIRAWIDETIGPERKTLTPEEQAKADKLRTTKDVLPPVEEKRKAVTTQDHIEDYLDTYNGRSRFESKNQNVTQFITDDAERLLHFALKNQPKDPTRWFDDMWKTMEPGYIASIMRETGLVDATEMTDFQRKKINDWVDQHIGPKEEAPDIKAGGIKPKPGKRGQRGGPSGGGEGPPSDETNRRIKYFENEMYRLEQQARSAKPEDVPGVVRQMNKVAAKLRKERQNLQDVEEAEARTKFLKEHPEYIVDPLPEMTKMPEWLQERIKEIKEEADYAEGLNQRLKAAEQAKLPPAEPSDAFKRMLERESKRIVSEQEGQAILDEAEDAGRNPIQIAKEFFENVYPNLDPAAKARIDRFLKASSGGFEPGEVIGTKPGPGGTRVPLVAESWMDVFDLGNRIDHLEGTERGLVAVMEYGNKNFKGRTKLPPAGPGETPRTESEPPAATAEGEAVTGGEEAPPVSPAKAEATPKSQGTQASEWEKWVNLLDELTPEERRRAIENLDPERPGGATPAELERWKAKLLHVQLSRKLGDSTRPGGIRPRINPKAGEAGSILNPFYKGKKKTTETGELKESPGTVVPGGPPVPPTALNAMVEGAPLSDIHGLSAQLRDWRARMGFTKPIEPGTGTSWRKAVQRGRDLLAADPDAAVKAIEKFRANGGKEVGEDMISVVRAKAEQMFQRARKIELARGKDAPDWKPVWDAAVEWDHASKPMQTVWGRTGMPQQGGVELDTGSFTDLQRYFKELTYDKDTGKWEEFTPKEKEKFDKLAKGVRQAEENSQEAQDAVPHEIEKALTKMEAKEEEERLRRSLEKTEVGTVGGEPSKEVVKATKKARKKATEKELGLTPRGVMNRARELFKIGDLDYDEIRIKIAQELGVSVDKVTELLAQPESMRHVTMEMWQRMSQARMLKQAAKRAVEDAALPMWKWWFRTVPRIFFVNKIFGHGAVGMVTHAGLNMFNPKVWWWKDPFTGKTVGYWPSFWQQWQFMLGEHPLRARGRFQPDPYLKGLGDKGAYHARVMAELTGDRLYALGRRAGLANDPGHYYDDFQLQQLEDVKGLGKITKQFREFTAAGQRGFDALKPFRQARFNQIWDSLPDHDKINVLLKPDGTHEIEPNLQMAKMVADVVNKATGYSSANLGIFKGAANLSLFAPRLEMARWGWLIRDPIKAMEYGAKWKAGTATPAEKQFVMRQVREKGAIALAYIGALILNQAMISWSGSKQRINAPVLDPNWNPARGDFMAFKAFGRQVSIISPLIGIVRVFAQMMHALGPRTKFEQIQTRGKALGAIASSYGRQKLSPFMGTVADVVTRHDFAGRPMPWSDEHVQRSAAMRGVKPYDWWEWGSEQISPIPVEEMLRELFNTQWVPKEDAEKWLSGIEALAVASTGARVSSDIYQPRDTLGGSVPGFRNVPLRQVPIKQGQPFRQVPIR